MKKILIILVGFFVGLMSLTFLAALGLIIILNWPMAIFSPSFLQKISAYAPRVGAELSFKEGNTSSVSHGFIDEEVSIHLNDFCVKYPPSLKKACFQKVDLNVRYSLEGLKPRIVSLGPIDLQGGEVVYQPEIKQEEKPLTAQINLPALQIPDMLKQTAFYPLSVELKHLEFVQGDTHYVAQATLQTITTDNHHLEKIELIGKAMDESHARSAGFSIEMNSPSYFKQDDWHVLLDVNGNLGNDKKGHLNATLTKTSPTGLSHDMKADFHIGKISGDLHLKGALNEKEFSAVVTGKLLGLHQEIPQITLDTCHLKNQVKNVEENDGHISLNCPIFFKLKSHALAGVKTEYYRLPSEAVLDVSIDADSFFYPDMEKPTQGSVKASLRPFKNGLIVTKGTAEMNLNGIPSKMPQDLKMVTHLDLDASIKDFSKLVDILKSTAWAVPAPLNVLKGPVKLSVKGDIPLWKNERTFPLDFSTRLYSEKEKLDIDVKGDAIVNFSSGKIAPSADLEINLSDIKLQLPTFTPPDIPQLIPDSRIKLSTKKKSSIPFDYHLKIKTTKPIEVSSNLVKSSIPVTLDVDVTPDKITGHIKVGEFLANLFRRDARVEYLNLELSDPRVDSELDGRLKVTYADYTIVILVQGTVDQPRIIFDSDPPLPQDAILATLFYGEPPEELDTEETNSIGEMSAAFGDRVLALSSMYLLASTPIERVHYNPQTRVFLARFRLGKGTSLSFGKGEDNYQVGVKRRLGKGWIINTSLENPSKTESSDAPLKGSAFIEWHKRY